MTRINKPDGLLSRLVLVLTVVLTAMVVLTACDTADGEDSLTDELDVEQLSPLAREYVELARQEIANLENTVPEAVILESITEPATADEPYVIDLATEGFIYTFEGLNGVVALTADPEPVVLDAEDPADVVPVDEAVLYSAADLVLALERAGATVAIPSEPEPAPDILAVPGQLVYVDGDPLNIYEYGDIRAATVDAGRISPDGTEISPLAEDATAATVDWVSSPSFYQLGNLLVLYGGDNDQTTTILEGVAGEPFAGG